ncbi:MAG: hypothetical protein ABSD44_07750 [Terracidiphilus sp.]
MGFWAKFNFFAAVLGVSAGPVPFALVALAVALSAVSLYYYLQVLKLAYVMPGIDDTPVKAHPVTMPCLRRFGGRDSIELFPCVVARLDCEFLSSHLTRLVDGMTRSDPAHRQGDTI